MSAKFNVAIVGIRGAVGQEMFKILKERKFPVNKLKLISTSTDKDFTDEHGNLIEKVRNDIFDDVDIGLFSPGASVSKIWAPIAAKARCVVIDNTSQFRMDEDVPLVVPEVNPDDIKKYTSRYIIANPNCSTIQMVVALKPLHDFARIKRVVVSTYQSVSGAGSLGMSELRRLSIPEVLGFLKSQENINHDLLEKLETEIKKFGLIKNPEKFQHSIAFNLIPHIDVPSDGLYTKEEIKMIKETKKIMGDDAIKVTATCVRVPVLKAHSESINIETENKVTREKALELLTNAPGVTVIDDLANNKYPLALDAQDKDDTFIGRIREDDTVANGLNLWVVSDNLRKGAALNAIQIAEHLTKILAPKNA